MDADLLLWIGQILLALAFLGVGYTHTLGFDQASTRPGMTWLAAVGRDRMRIIGILEILGAVGLIIVNAILGAIATLIAYGRFVVAPF
ncbi:MAG: DoxX family protein [Candidatus Limnocylindrales bacterium]|nr:DoxX family protein [Candidatus Limnocylindrales bacterium]